MRNLKRALSLLLAALMLMGMMVVGAGAAGIDDFSDKDEIVNKDAVSMLTILGVINGKEDGSYYAPKDNVTRAEMAKMIATILNQGADVNDLYANLNTGLTDIDNSWAKGYINYCYSLGIIAGRGDGRFDPTAPVTGNEAAKMLLVAIGYNPDVEGLTGSAWAIKTTALASTLGIFDNLTVPTQDKLNRDNAALLIYNALDVEMIQSYTQNGYALVYSDHRTLLSNKYGVYKVEGVVTANEWAQLDGTDSDATAAKGKTTLEDVVVYESTTSNTTVAGNPENLPVTFNVSTPVDYMGKAVTMYVKKTTILANSSVLGVTVNDNVNVIQGTVANTTEVKDLLKGTGLAVDANTEYYVNYGAETAASSVSLINNYAWGETGSDFNLNGIDVQLIDNDSDGKVEYVLYLRETLSNVIRTSEKDETVTLYAPVVNNAGILTNGTRTMVLDNADVVTDLDLAADDLVLYTQYGGRTYITEPTIITGKMTRVDRDKANELYVTLDDGETYKQSYIREVESVVDADIERFVIADAKNDIGFTTEYDFILDSNGYIVAYRPTEAVVDNYALVVGSAWTQNALTKEGQVKVVTADGTTASYDINWDASIDAFNGANDDAREANMERYLGTRDVDQGDGVNTLGAAAGTVIEYTLSDDNILTIKHVLQLNDLNANGDLRVSTTDDKDNIDVGTNANGQPVAYIAENNNAEVVIGGSSFMPANSTPNLQYTLTNKYESGDGTIDVTVNGVRKTYAIDQNTIAFYYNGDGYAAIGWDEMGDVAANTPVQIYQTVKKSGGDYTATNLVDVVLFNAALTTNTADYLLVLSANAVDANNLELNVVLEDGTAETITVDKDDYTWFDNDAHFMAAYPYSVNADGEYTIKTGNANMIGRVDALLLENGTVDTDRAYTNYLTISKDSAIWDVTDVDSADDQVSAGSFDRNQVKNAVIITDNKDINGDGRVVRTAWVWDSDIIYVDSTASVAELNRALRDAQSTTQQQVRIDGSYDASALTGTIMVPANVTLTVTGKLTLNRTYGMDLDGHLVAKTWKLNGATVTGTGSFDVETLEAGSVLSAGLTGTVQNVVLNDTVTIAADITVTGDVKKADTAPAGTKIVTGAKANIVVKGTVEADVDNTAGAVVDLAGMVGNVTGNVTVDGETVTGEVNKPAEGGTDPEPTEDEATVKVTGTAGDYTVAGSGNFKVAEAHTITVTPAANKEITNVTADNGVTFSKDAKGVWTATIKANTIKAGTVITVTVVSKDVETPSTETTITSVEISGDKAPYGIKVNYTGKEPVLTDSAVKADLIAKINEALAAKKIDLVVAEVLPTKVALAKDLETVIGNLTYVGTFKVLVNGVDTGKTVVAGDKTKVQVPAEGTFVVAGTAGNNSNGLYVSNRGVVEVTGEKATADINLVTAYKLTADSSVKMGNFQFTADGKATAVGSYTHFPNGTIFTVTGTNTAAKNASQKLTVGEYVVYDGKADKAAMTYTFTLDASKMLDKDSKDTFTVKETASTTTVVKIGDTVVNTTANVTEEFTIAYKDAPNLVAGDYILLAVDKATGKVADFSKTIKVPALSGTTYTIPALSVDGNNKAYSTADADYILVPAADAVTVGVGLSYTASFDGLTAAKVNVSDAAKEVTLPVDATLTVTSAGEGEIFKIAQVIGAGETATTEIVLDTAADKVYDYAHPVANVDEGKEVSFLLVGDQKAAVRPNGDASNADQSMTSSNFDYAAAYKQFGIALDTTTAGKVTYTVYEGTVKSALSNIKVKDFTTKGDDFATSMSAGNKLALLAGGASPSIYAGVKLARPDSGEAATVIVNGYYQSPTVIDLDTVTWKSGLSGWTDSSLFVYCYAYDLTGTDGEAEDAIGSDIPGTDNTYNLTMTWLDADGNVVAVTQTTLSRVVNAGTIPA